jgi:hypothetical protein
MVSAISSFSALVSKLGGSKSQSQSAKGGSQGRKLLISIVLLAVLPFLKVGPDAYEGNQKEYLAIAKAAIALLVLTFSIEASLRLKIR